MSPQGSRPTGVPELVEHVLHEAGRDLSRGTVARILAARHGVKTTRLALAAAAESPRVVLVDDVFRLVEEGERCS